MDPCIRAAAPSCAHPPRTPHDVSVLAGHREYPPLRLHPPRPARRRRPAPTCCSPRSASLADPAGRAPPGRDRRRGRGGGGNHLHRLQLREGAAAGGYGCGHRRCPKPGGSRPLRPARLRAEPPWWVDADSAPALPRDSAMSAMACGKHMVRLVGVIPAAGPMTTRVPPSIRGRMAARGRCHTAAGDHDVDHSRAGGRVVTNRVLQATGTAGGAAGEPAVAAWREASFGATAAPRISPPVRGRPVAERGEQLTAERCAGLLFEEHVRFRAGPCAPRADAVPGGPADALQRLPYLSPQVSAAVAASRH